MNVCGAINALQVKTVYAEFIPSSWDEEKVKDTFKKFGEIEDIVLARNLRTSKRRDFAFVSYKTRAAAIKCIESFGHDLRDDDGTKVFILIHTVCECLNRYIDLTILYIYFFLDKCEGFPC